MKRRKPAFLLLFAVLLTRRPFGDSGSKPLNLPSDQQVLTFLTESVDWYQHLMIQRQMETEPADLIFLYDTRQITHQIVQLSFDFARVNGSLATASGRERQTSTEDSSWSDGVRFIRMQRKAEDAIDHTAQGIESLEKKLLQARGAERKRVQAELDDLRSRSQLLQAESARLKELIDFTRASSAQSSRVGIWKRLLTTSHKLCPK